jgi:hypothetical protein
VKTGNPDWDECHLAGLSREPEANHDINAILTVKAGESLSLFSLRNHPDPGQPGRPSSDKKM